MARIPTSFDFRNQVRYESIHDVHDEHWCWLMDAAAPEDGDLILDAGCGYGSCSKELLERRCDSTFVIDLVDESRIQLDRAELELPQILAKAALKEKPSARSVLNYINESVGTEWSSTRQYDKIFLKMVLHETPKEEQATFLNAFHRVLKPGGVLIVWDLALDDAVSNFFHEVIAEKDRLLGFETLLKRRHFLTADEFLTVAAKSHFTTAETVKLFDQNFISERRIDCEFKGNRDTYRQWLEFVIKKCNSLSEPVKKALRLEVFTESDNIPSVRFVVSRAIWRLIKPNFPSVFNTLSVVDRIDAHLAPTSARQDLPKHIQEAAQKGINLLGEKHLLCRHKGLIRVTTFDLKDKGKRELSKDGIDYIYSYKEPLGSIRESFVNPLLTAYYRHMAYIYHRKKVATVDRGRTLTDYLNNIGKHSANASWLRIFAPSLNDSNGSATIDVTLCRGAEKIFYDSLVIAKYNNCKDALLRAYVIPDDCLSCSEPSGFSTKIQCQPGNQSIDAVANDRVNKLTALPVTHRGVRGVSWRLNALPDDAPIDALIGFGIFLEEAGLSYGCYILPPTPLDSHQGRSDPAAVFYSSDVPLTHQEEQVVFGFAAKMWGAVRGLEWLSASHSFINTAYREDIQNKSQDRAFFARKILFPLLFSDQKEIDPKDSISQDGESPTSPLFNDWAARLPRAFASGDLESLLKYVCAEDEGVSETELQTIKDIEHEIRESNFANKTLVEIQQQIRRARDMAREGGALFDREARLLDSAEDDCSEFALRESALEKCKLVNSHIDQLETKDRSVIEELCNANQKVTINIKPYNHILDCEPFPDFKFGISKLKGAVSALRNNADKNESTAYSLRYYEEPTRCVITWLEKCKTKEWDIEGFKTTLLASANRSGIHRGLPRVVMFGLESAATKIELLSKNGWHTIWPKQDTSVPVESQEKEFNYGFRFTFTS